MAKQKGILHEEVIQVLPAPEIALELIVQNALEVEMGAHPFSER